MAEAKPRSSSSRAAKSAGEHQYSEEIGTALLDGLTFRSKPVQYVVVDGMALVEGDINLGPVEQVVDHTDMRRAELAGAPVAAAVAISAISGSQFRWPNCTIPYQVSDDLPNQDRVTEAIAHWEANTNYRFVLRTPANTAQFPDWVEFVPGSGCSSFVGRQGGRQTVTLGGGCSTGNTIHEIGHAVGLWHEQSREDRDTFVTINFANIIPAAINNFAQHIADGDDIGPYDYGSIMHYPRDAFSANGQDTIVPTNPAANIGQRTALSAGDIAAVNSLCGPIPTPPTQPTFPTRPTFPTQPTRPTFPTQPTRPTFPTQPTAPTFPTQPTRPTFPTQPTAPTFPTQPTRPTFPTQPTAPTFPTQPTAPTFPTRPTRPTAPTFPTRPTRPTFPTRPTAPTFPTLPTRPPTFPPPPFAGPADPSGGYYDPYGYGAYSYDPYASTGYYDPYAATYGAYSYDPYASTGYYDPYATTYSAYSYDPYASTGYYDPYATTYSAYSYDPYATTGYYDPYATTYGAYSYDPYATTQYPSHDPFGSIEPKGTSDE